MIYYIDILGFIVDTKVPGFQAGAHSAENVAKSVVESLRELKTNKVILFPLVYIFFLFFSSHQIISFFIP
jgi:hypothetical protein